MNSKANSHLPSTKARVGRSPFQLMNGTGEKLTVHGRKLSTVVRYVSPNELHPNPLNARFFRETTETELQSLMENINANGIHDPLIARADGVLIAGHNRLRAALALQLSVVPVRYVEEDLTEQDEVRFIIADNLLRRHLTNEQRMELYRVFYPDFEARIELARNPSRTGALKGMKSLAGEQSIAETTKKGMDNVHSFEVHSFDNENTRSALEPLTSAQIAADTGQSVSAVQKQLQRGFATRSKQTSHGTSGTNRTTSPIENAHRELQDIRAQRKLLLTRLADEPVEFKRQVLKEFQKLVEELDAQIRRQELQ